VVGQFVFDEGTRSTRWKPPTSRKSLYRLRLVWAEFELTNSVHIFH